MSLTLLEECSHINAFKLMKNGYDPNPIASQNYTDYLLDPSSSVTIDSTHPNAIFIVYIDKQWLSGAYRLDYVDYKAVSDIVH